MIDIESRLRQFRIPIIGGVHIGASYIIDMVWPIPMWRKRVFSCLYEDHLHAFAASRGRGWGSQRSVAKIREIFRNTCSLYTIGVDVHIGTCPSKTRGSTSARSTPIQSLTNVSTCKQKVQQVKTISLKNIALFLYNREYSCGRNSNELMESATLTC